jgi:subtilisin family serine protease
MPGKFFLPFFLLLVGLVLVLAFFLQRKSGVTVLVIDSGFAATKENCFLIHDGNYKVPSSGDCYHAPSWEKLRSEDPAALAAYLRSPNPEWKAYSEKHPEAEARLSVAFDLNAHGTMVEEVIRQASEATARIARLRNMNSQAGTLAHEESSTVLEDGLKPFREKCPLVKWELKERESEFLQPDEQRVMSLLSQDSSIRVVNMSSGSRRSWIQEDLPACSPSEVSTEFDVNVASWRQVLRTFPNVVFVASSGNESSDFSDPAMRDDHIWAKLSDEPNLVVVGALNREGSPFRANNFGLAGMVWAKGDFDLTQPSPDPGKNANIRFFGTSAAAPWISGVVAKEIARNPSVKVEELRAMLAKEYGRKF